MSEFFFQGPPTGFPQISDPERAASAIDDLRNRDVVCDDYELGSWIGDAVDHPSTGRLLMGMFSSSPFLTNCALAEIPFLKEVLTKGPDSAFVRAVDGLKDHTTWEAEESGLMRTLRIARRRVALLVALADLAGHWPLERVTQALSDFIDAALSATISHLMLDAVEKGDFSLPEPDFPEDDCGYVVLAMGKHGARELNYSSDIDPILLYDPMKMNYRGEKGLQQALVRLTHRFVKILQERTADGYVCRVDLRLRPDPSSTPIVVSTATAQTYYATRGENWERAAMIKARPCAGDITLGRRFLTELDGFVWREHLDFWTASEVEAIKRRINAHKGGSEIAFLGHNIKIGRGGIREIEFFAQTHQLIFAGRDAYLRCPRTVEALTTLAEAGHIDDRVADDLSDAYEFLRRLEHRLQMVGDQQTQLLPSDEEGMTRIAGFMGFDDLDRFQATLIDHLERVGGAYTDFFEQVATEAEAAALDFAREEPDEHSTAFLEKLGFEDVPKVYDRLRRWQTPVFRSTRDERCRTLLAKLIPRIAQRASRTADPDRTLDDFERYLQRLRTGTHCFSLLAANPKLVDFLVEMITTAPAITAELGHRTHQFEAVLDPGFFAPFPDRRVLIAEVAQEMRKGRDDQEALEYAVIWANDHRFRIASNVLRHAIGAQDTGHALSDIADAIVIQLHDRLTSGRDSPSDFAVVAVGRWGARELTYRDGLDLLFFFDEEASDGETSLRLARRLTWLLSAATNVGSLAEVNLGDRRSGGGGPILVPLGSVSNFPTESEDVTPLLDLIGARVVAGNDSFKQTVSDAIQAVLTTCPDKFRCEPSPPRATSDWKVRMRCDALDDLEQLARQLQLRHAQGCPGILDVVPTVAFTQLGEQGLMEASVATGLTEARQCLRQVENLLAVAMDGSSDMDAASDELKTALLRATSITDFDALEAALDESKANIQAAVEAAA